MSDIAILKNNVAQPYSLEDFRRDHPNVSLTCELSELTDDELSAFKLTRLVPTTPPVCAADEEVVMTAPVLADDGHWSNGWMVRKRVQIFPEVSARQIRQALTRLGCRQAFESAIATASPDIRDWWEFSVTYERHATSSLEVAQLLAWDDAKLDELWAQAAVL